MLKKNSFLTGILIAVVFPAIAFLVAYLLKTNVTVINKPALPYLGAIAINLILMRIGLKRELDLTARGIMLTTFVLMLVIFLFVIHPVR